MALMSAAIRRVEANFIGRFLHKVVFAVFWHNHADSILSA
ncbi:hypothetical protein SXCC_00553 [Gluconacetobacter sp. SXCC-1]|nr:hypothetical protein SXCC_00553 [Gluconacetobacter sp. SXCC-1]